jgi:predicted nicotinamide N-methyase
MNDSRFSMDNEESSSGTSTPKATHPTARAFFDALDNGSTSSKQSESLKRKSQSLGWRNRHSQDEFYPVSIGTALFSVKQVQRGEVEGTYGTGATVWPAALVLIKYMERHPSLVRGKHVVDLGSGTGVTSVAAALLGASHVLCTDGEQNVVRLASENIMHAAGEIKMQDATTTTTTTTDLEPTMINKCPIDVRTYWWGDGSLKASGCELVIVADCVLPKLYPIAPLVQAIDELLETPNAVAILSYEHRYYPDYDPRDKFRELATTRGLQISLVEQGQFDPVYCVDDIEIWHVMRK